jgi:hypothetical protein
VFTSARRNGIAPDTGIDGIYLSGDGSVQLVQTKHHAMPSSRSSGARRSRGKRGTRR